MKNEPMETERPFTRRNFFKATGLGVGAALLAGPEILAADAPKRRLKIGHTGITWGYRPENAAQAIKDVASLGYAGYETFGQYFEPLQAQGGIKPMLDAARLRLISAYCVVNLTDPAIRRDEVAKIVRWGKYIQECGGTVAVIGPNNVPRNEYDFATHKSAIVAALDDMGRALADIGMIGALHQHTGTCVETRDEVYAVFDAVDTRHVKFGPDVGQLAKGGSDPVQVVRDHLELVEHVHLKDWNGGDHWEEYCPLGTGRIAVPEILDLLEKSSIKEMIMVELDWGGPNPPMPPIETARIAKAYLQKHGYAFPA